MDSSTSQVNLTDRLDTLKFDDISVLQQWFLGESGESLSEMVGSAVYDADDDVVYLSDDNIRSVVHELCERDLYFLLGFNEIQNTHVGHILSPYKGGNWGRWRLWGTARLNISPAVGYGRDVA